MKKALAVSPNRVFKPQNHVCVLPLTYKDNFPIFLSTKSEFLSLSLKILTPIIFFLCVVGSYAMRFSFFDVGLSLIIGVIAYFMEYYGYSASPILLALILGPMAEQNLRRSLIISHGDPLIFFTRPICAAFLIIAIFVMITSYYRIKKAMDREAQAVAEEEMD